MPPRNKPPWFIKKLWYFAIIFLLSASLSSCLNNTKEKEWNKWSVNTEQTNWDDWWKSKEGCSYPVPWKWVKSSWAINVETNEMKKYYFRLPTDQWGKIKFQIGTWNLKNAKVMTRVVGTEYNSETTRASYELITSCYIAEKKWMKELTIDLDTLSLKNKKDSAMIEFYVLPSNTDPATASIVWYTISESGKKLQANN